MEQRHRILVFLVVLLNIGDVGGNQSDIDNRGPALAGGLVVKHFLALFDQYLTVPCPGINIGGKPSQLHRVAGRVAVLISHPITEARLFIFSIFIDTAGFEHRCVQPGIVNGVVEEDGFMIGGHGIQFRGGRSAAVGGVVPSITVKKLIIGVGQGMRLDHNQVVFFRFAG